MSGREEPPLFEQVDWDDVSASSRSLSKSTRTFLTGVVLLAVLYWYDTTIAHVYLIADWEVVLIDWVFFLACITIIAFGVVPAFDHRRQLELVVSRIRESRLATVAGIFLLSMGVIALLEPLLFRNVELQFQYAFQPPFGFTSETTPRQCVGDSIGSGFDLQCKGSLIAPLGTNQRGFPLSYLVATGARVALYVVVITAAFVVPLAAIVGVTAGLAGGRLDDILMTYVDVQLSVPAIVLYLIGWAYWNPSLLLLIGTFGAVSWGGIARLVRSETLQRREGGYVLVARSLGASRSYIARRHILPNITNTLLPAVAHLLALFVLIEAGIAFLGFHQIDMYSWGSTISESLIAAVPTEMQTRAPFPPHKIWWVSTVPALALTGTVLSLKLLGDATRDALDPRGDE